MDIPAYLRFCPPGQPFFDVPDRDLGRFVLSDAEVPYGWQRASDAEWVNVLPPEPLVEQGWKVHVSATPENCVDVLQVCWDYCTAAGLAFKFLKSSEVLFLRSGKYGDRTASGKFVTLYPRDEAALQQVLDELGPLLEGFTGPSILSDLRWRGGPLYVRYGAFVRMQLQNGTGEPVLALRQPDGTLVPDDRRPGFHVPEWVALPSCLQEAVVARSQGRLTGFPYRPTQALHFSNGGGVYRGVDARGGVVLMKEARPHAGMDGTGEDAVVRLERERWALERLAGLPQVPRLFDHRRGHEHFFLVREEVDGVALAARVGALHPMLQPGGSAADVPAYTDWALKTLTAVEAGVAAMHARGVAHRDLHPGNILVRPDDTLVFIDFEASRPVEDEVEQAIGAPGYIAPPGYRGRDVDRYALGVLALDLFVPLAQVVRWGPHKLEEILELVERDFPVPADFAARVRRHLAPSAPPADVPATPPLVVVGASIPAQQWGPSGSRTSWRTTTEALADGILASASPQRRDRLYPGDPAQLLHATAGLGLLYGAGGVLWALRRSGMDVPQEHLAWYRRAVEAADWDRAGLADGLGGVALALHGLGEQDRAHDVLSQAVRLGVQTMPARLADGLSGLGLCLLSLAAEDRDEALVRRAERLVPSITAWTPDPRDRRWGPGLLGGASGPALFLTRLYECTGDVGLLDQAELALRKELCGAGWGAEQTGLPLALTRSPSLARGGGTALVLQALLRHRTAPDLLQASHVLREACAVPFAAEAGLLHGRAGLLAVLAGLGGADADCERHARDIRVHGVLVDGRPLVTGRFSLRATCDLATGSAGVMLALHDAREALRLLFLSSPDDEVAVAGPHSGRDRQLT